MDNIYKLKYLKYKKKYLKKKGGSNTTLKENYIRDKNIEYRDKLSEVLYLSKNVEKILIYSTKESRKHRKELIETLEKLNRLANDYKLRFTDRDEIRPLNCSLGYNQEDHKQLYIGTYKSTDHLNNGIDLFKSKCVKTAEIDLGLEIAVEKGLLEKTTKYEYKFTEEGAYILETKSVTVILSDGSETELKIKSFENFTRHDTTADIVGQIVYNNRSRLLKNIYVKPEILSFYVLKYSKTVDVSDSDKVKYERFSSDTMPQVCCKSYTFREYGDMHKIGNNLIVAYMGPDNEFSIYKIDEDFKWASYGKETVETSDLAKIPKTVLKTNMSREEVINKYYELSIERKKRIKNNIDKQLDNIETIKIKLTELLNNIKIGRVATEEMMNIAESLKDDIISFDKLIKNVLDKCTECSEHELSCGWNQMCTEPKRIELTIIEFNKKIEEKYNSIKELYDYEMSYQGYATSLIKKYLNPKKIITKIGNAFISLTNTIIKYKYQILKTIAILTIIAIVVKLGSVLLVKLTALWSTVTSFGGQSIVIYYLCRLVTSLPVIIPMFIFTVCALAPDRNMPEKATAAASTIFNIFTNAFRNFRRTDVTPGVPVEDSDDVQHVPVVELEDSDDVQHVPVVELEDSDDVQIIQERNWEEAYQANNANVPVVVLDGGSVIADTVETTGAVATITTAVGVVFGAPAAAAVAPYVAGAAAIYKVLKWIWGFIWSFVSWYTGTLMTVTLGSISVTGAFTTLGTVLPPGARRVYFAVLSTITGLIAYYYNNLNVAGRTVCSGVWATSMSFETAAASYDAVVSVLSYTGQLIYGLFVTDTSMPTVPESDFINVFIDFLINHTPASLMWLINFLYTHSTIFVSIVGGILSALYHVVTEVEEYPEDVVLFEDYESFKTKSSDMSMNDLIKRTDELYTEEYYE